MLAVAEAARNVACAGATPARRDQLPELRQSRAAGDHVAVRAGGRGHRRRHAARSDVPITGGNVSLYNETDGQAIYPDAGASASSACSSTPIVSSRRRVQARGRRHRAARRGPRRARRQRVSEDRARSRARRAAGARSRRASARCSDCWSTLAEQRLMRSAHDCSDGGLAVTLAECCFDTGGIGAEVSIDAVERRRADARRTTPRRCSANRRRASSCRRRRTT